MTFDELIALSKAQRDALPIFVFPNTNVNSRELENCQNCTNCSTCTDCNLCTDCSNLRTCNNCTNCHGSKQLVNCANCVNCNRCRDCTDCISCSELIKCTGCKNTTECIGIQGGENKRYVGWDVQMTKQQWDQLMNLINSGG